MPELAPLVTIGIATYRRLLMLQRAVESALRQTWPRIELLISNNDPTQPIDKSVNVSLLGDRRVTIFNQPTNLGQIGNYRFLISKANGSYFMFLNDDDEIGPKTIATLASHLNDNPDSVTVMGDWITRNEAREERIEKVVSYSGSVVSRLSKFLLRSQDVGFHGLHRTSTLRKARWVEFKYQPEALTNICYPVLFDIVLEGNLVHLERSDARFVNQVGHRKHYKTVSSLRLLVRKLELHAVYVKKGFSVLGGRALLWLIPVVFFAVVKSLARTYGVAFRSYFRFAR